MLFTLLAERYERGSVLLTSNLAFSKWDQIFKDAMTTAAAIDRLVHHSVIIELNVPSFPDVVVRICERSPAAQGVKRKLRDRRRQSARSVRIRLSDLSHAVQIVKGPGRYLFNGQVTLNGPNVFNWFGC